MSNNDSKFKSAVNLPIAIPVWSLVTMMATGVFGAGAMYNKMDQLVETVKESRQQLANQAPAIAAMQFQQQNHEARITNLERVALERKVP